MHGYRTKVDPSVRPRINLIIPSINPNKVFGGVATGLEIFTELGGRTGADLRVILDEIGAGSDRTVLDNFARRANIDPDAIEVLRRFEQEPLIAVRPMDVFMPYNWWAVLNQKVLLEAQQDLRGGRRNPYIYLYQEFEPGFYSFSSTHLLAWAATKGAGPWWAIYNSSQLANFVEALGAKAPTSFILEPQLSGTLRPFVDQRRKKKKQIFVYGRPFISRNCFPAVLSGLREWAESYSGAHEWEVISAGSWHPPIRLSKELSLTSVGKLTLDGYARVLQESSVGLSLMSSPHPSYPPLEMAHFGVLTVTNSYAFKDLSASHENITSLDSIASIEVSKALTVACDRFDRNPDVGWEGKSHLPHYLNGDKDVIDDVAARLARDWAGL